MTQNRTRHEAGGRLPGPIIQGNLPQAEDPERTLFRLPHLDNGRVQAINIERLGFSYFVHRNGVHVTSDLNSDFEVRRVWSAANVAKAIEKARRTLDSYGCYVDLDTLLADGWQAR